MEEQIKMFMFARWISTCYADDHLDKNMKHCTQEGFDSTTQISVLNRENGYWWKEQLNHFNEVVYPNYLKNGSVEDTRKFLSK